MRRKCPDMLCKYGWCGVLALHYALDLEMPTTEAKFTQRLSALRKIIGDKLPRWKASTKPKQRGGITTTQTEVVLAHYHKRCGYMVERFKDSGARMTVNFWLKTHAKRTPSSRYIVHTGKHVVFVDVPKRVTKWVLYDQAGPQTSAHLPLINGKGKVGRQQVQAVFTITHPLDLLPDSPFCPSPLT